MNKPARLQEQLQQLAESSNNNDQIHAINHCTLLILLLRKGLVTEEELAEARVKATHIVDQEWTRKLEEGERKQRDEILREFTKRYTKKPK